MCNRLGNSGQANAESWEHQNRGKMPDISSHTAIAVRAVGGLDQDGFPAEIAWDAAPPTRFDADWRGENPDPQRRTEVRLLWAPETLYLRFDAWYRTIAVFPDAEPSGRRDHLWDRDVCETFLQPNPGASRGYKEFEIAPNGFWIDLDILPGEKHDLHSGLRRRVHVDEQNKKWRGELAIPMQSLISNFRASDVWRANFFRVEGESDSRFYSTWRPTLTPQPNFHVPDAFGALIFTEAGGKIRK